VQHFGSKLVTSQAQEPSDEPHYRALSRRTGFFRTPAGLFRAEPPAASAWPGRSPKQLGAKGFNFPWGRLIKFTCFVVLAAVGIAVLYRQFVVKVSREAVINARVAVIRAQIDGIATTSITIPGSPVKAGAPIGQLEDPLADDTLLIELHRDTSVTEIERAALAGRLADLERAQTEATQQAEAYRAGRVKELEQQVQEAQTNLAAASAREADAKDAASRGNTLYSRGFQSDQAQEKLRHQQEIARQAVLAAGNRLAALSIELEAAREGTFLGDSYNDVPYSLQRARELALQIAETRTELDEASAKGVALRTEIAEEQHRLEAHTRAKLTAPVDGNLWSVDAEPGEYVRKGQDIMTVLDCSSAVVTASVAARDYNELRLGDPVRFRVAGTERAYDGHIVRLGSSATFAIPPVVGEHQIVVALSDLAASGEDGCAVGRIGEVTFKETGNSLPARLSRRLLGLFNLF
jgi:biotin carboxyl carrier protein